MFGIPRFVRDGEVCHFPRKKSLALLCYLSLQSRPVSRDELGMLLWNDGQKGRANLRRVLPSLRSTLGSVLQTTRDIVTLGREALWVDVLEFDHLAQPNSRLLPAQLEAPNLRLTDWQQAADLYKGEFLKDLRVGSERFAHWRDEQERQWAVRIATLLHNLSHALFLRDDLDAAERYALQWASLEETEEQAHRLLMQIYLRKGNRSKALEQYETCKKILGTYDLVPTNETQRLYEKIARQVRLSPGVRPPGQKRTPAPRSSADRKRRSLATWNPPPLPNFLTPFVGREDDIHEAVDCLRKPDCRLLTVHAPGGMGKTRLAVQVAEQCRQDFSDGVLFVDLSAVPENTNLFSALYLYLPEEYREHHGGKSPEEIFLAFMASRCLLLVLDNFEHLTSQAWQVTSLLQACPQVKCLVTSRERLNLSEEWVLSLEGLPYPQELSSSDNGLLLSRYSAVQLFVQRARQNAPHFAVTDDNRDAIVRICQIAEGMPLALEMAAAWVEQLPCEVIASKLEDQLDFLESTYRNIPGRHRSIRASCQHSWELLTPEEQRGLSKFSVFHRGCDYKAATTVTGLRLAEIADLVNKSWLRTNARGRYLVHAFIHQFLWEQLQKQPVLAQETLREHAYYYAEDLKRIGQEFVGHSQKAALDYASEDLENLVSAWEWAVQHQNLDILDAMCQPLFDFYRLRNLFVAGKERFSTALRALEKQGALHEHPVYNRLQNRFAWFVYVTDDFTQASALWQDGLRRAEALGDTLEAAFCNHHLGLVSQHQGKLAQAQVHLVQAMQQYKQAGTAYHVALNQKQLGYVTFKQKDYPRAEALFRQCMQTFETVGDQYNIGVVYTYLSDCAYAQERNSEALFYARKAIEFATHTGNQRLHAFALNRLARSLPSEEAVRVYTTITMIFESLEDWARTAISYCNMAAEFINLEQYAEAEESYQAALSIFRERRDKRGCFFTTFDIGRMYIKARNAKKAHQYLQDALLQALDMGEVPLGLYALSGVGEICAALDDWPHALALAVFILEHPETQDDARANAEAIVAQGARKLSEAEMALYVHPYPPTHYHRLIEEYLETGTFTLPQAAKP